MKLGILTSGGDCPGLNAVIRAFCKYAFNNIDGVEIYGIEEGYLGLINRQYRRLYPADVENILDLGGTILGSTRTPYKLMTVSDNGEATRLQTMVENYKKLKLDGLIALGGAGTHKTASLLSVEGCNVIGLPKTIDNDIYGTDVTFGFNTAVQTAADCIKRIRTTADSHSRVFFVEVMGNKVGWLTLYSGLASGADGIFIPEISYDENSLAQYLKKRKADGCRSTIIAVAEGAISTREAAMGKKERKDYLAAAGNASAAQRCAAVAELNTGISCRATVLGHIQRGGDPCAYDKVLCTRIGAYGGMLVKQGKFGVTVAVHGSKLSYNSLTEIAGRTKYVPADSQIVTLAKDMGVYFGE